MKEGNNLSRMIRISHPKVLIYIGLIISMPLGAISPCFAIIMNSVIFGLSRGLHTLEEIRSNANMYCLAMFLFAFSSFTLVGFQKFIFGYLSENVTLKMRKILYQKMLEKHMGWFDEKENAPG